MAWEGCEGCENAIVANPHGAAGTTEGTGDTGGGRGRGTARLFVTREVVTVRGIQHAHWATWINDQTKHEAQQPPVNRARGRKRANEDNAPTRATRPSGLVGPNVAIQGRSVCYGNENACSCVGAIMRSQDMLGAGHL